LIELACSYVRSPKQTGKLMCATLLFNFFAFLSFVIDTNANKHTYPSFLDECLLEMAKMYDVDDIDNDQLSVVTHHVPLILYLFSYLTLSIF
jgi:hypothetical protein